jgi:MoaA/NifB/PqqE/SkfB family radical SAM enzyme
MAVREAEIKLGYTCNNNCRFCLNAGKREQGDLSTEEVKNKILECTKKQNINYISFTGGEPTIRRDFFELCSFVKKLGFQLEVQTNARMFSYDRFAERACDTGLDNVLVSLHGHTARLHDFLTRSPGSFKQAVKGIKNLKAHEIYISSNSIINNYNLKYLKNIVKLLIKLKVDQIQLTWPEPMGAAWDNFYEIVPKYSVAFHSIKKALDSFGKKSRILVINIPACIMGKYSKFLVNPDEKIDFELQGVFTTEQIVSEKKCMLPLCDNCIKRNVCGGIYKSYLEKYGHNEINPVRR